MIETPATRFARSWTVGSYVVTLTSSLQIVDSAIDAHLRWSPSPPKALRRKERSEYRAGHAAAFEDLTRELAKVMQAAAKEAT